MLSVSSSSRARRRASAGGRGSDETARRLIDEVRNVARQVRDVQDQSVSTHDMTFGARSQPIALRTRGDEDLDSRS